MAREMYRTFPLVELIDEVDHRAHTGDTLSWWESRLVALLDDDTDALLYGTGVCPQPVGIFYGEGGRHAGAV